MRGIKEVRKEMFTIFTILSLFIICSTMFLYSEIPKKENLPMEVCEMVEYEEFFILNSKDDYVPFKGEVDCEENVDIIVDHVYLRMNDLCDSNELYPDFYESDEQFFKEMRDCEKKIERTCFMKWEEESCWLEMNSKRFVISQDGEKK